MGNRKRSSGQISRSKPSKRKEAKRKKTVDEVRFRTNFSVFEFDLDPDVEKEEEELERVKEAQILEKRKQQSYKSPENRRTVVRKVYPLPKLAASTKTVSPDEEPPSPVSSSSRSSTPLGKHYNFDISDGEEEDNSSHSTKPRKLFI